MTNNTTNNVPRELKPCPFCGGEPNLTTADYVHDDLTPMPVVECKSCSAWVQADDWNTRAPSPAGVDGCKCSMSISMLGDGCRYCQPQEYIDRLSEMLDEERDRLSDAQAIIDGLRGENERIRLNIAEYNEAISCYQSERDQQAQRIGELEGLLREWRRMFDGGLESGQLGVLRGHTDAALSTSGAPQ